MVRAESSKTTLSFVVAILDDGMHRYVISLSVWQGEVLGWYWLSMLKVQVLFYNVLEDLPNAMSGDGYFIGMESPHCP